MRGFSRFLPALLGVLLCGTVGASAPAGATEGLAYGQGILWQVQKEGGEPSYVFGTMHVTDDEVLRLPDPVWEAFDNSDRALFEAKIRDERAMRMAGYMYLPEGRNLKNMLDRKTYIKALQAAHRLGIPEGRLQRLRPWALYFALSYAPAAEAERRRDGMVFLDLGLQRLAHRRGKSIHGLEKLEDQLAFFLKLSEAEAIAFAKGTLENPSDVDAEFQVMLESYLDRDLDSIMAQMNEELDGPAAALQERFIEMFINDRNRNMVEAMQEYLDLGHAFVAVGASHLPGEKGVLNLLAQQGYEVTHLY